MQTGSITIITQMLNSTERRCSNGDENIIGIKRETKVKFDDIQNNSAKADADASLILSQQQQQLLYVIIYQVYFATTGSQQDRQ